LSLHQFTFTMKTRQTSFHRLIQAVLCLGLISSASASTIFWGSKFEDTLVDSAGANLDASFEFEIGYFDGTGGWTPTAANMSEWDGRWIAFDRASVGNGWDAANREINKSVNHTATSGSDSPIANPSSVFTQGATAYLWVFDSKDFLTKPEWALVCDSDKSANVFPGAWEFPNPNEQNGESYDWQTRDLDTAIFGAVNGVRGPGEFSVDPGVFTIQTHVVPEPGSALLLIATGAVFLRRRRLSL
jgi:hypothetical protein